MGNFSPWTGRTRAWIRDVAVGRVWVDVHHGGQGAGAHNRLSRIDKKNNYRLVICLRHISKESEIASPFQWIW